MEMDFTFTNAYGGLKTTSQVAGVRFHVKGAFPPRPGILQKGAEREKGGAGNEFSRWKACPAPATVIE